MPWIPSEAEQAELRNYADQLGRDIGARLDFHPDGAIGVHARRGGDNPLQLGHVFTAGNLDHAKREIEAQLKRARSQFDRVR